MAIRNVYTPYDVERTRKAIMYMDSHYKEGISADQLAEEVQMDKRKLQMVMQILTGHTVHHYLIKLRIDHAIEDLNNKFELTIKQIAFRNGFVSSSWFIKHFRVRMEITPKEYRFQLLYKGKAL